MVASRILAVLLALAASFAPAAAQAPDPDLPPVDPPGHWRQMTADDATSDSKCVGKFDTPLCAVETVIACLERIRDDLCTLARVDRADRRFSSGLSSHVYRRLYGVRHVERFRELSKFKLPPAVTRIFPGDVRIDIQTQLCSKREQGDHCGPPHYDTTIFAVRLTSQGWRVVNWGIEIERISGN
jgi:hypothetical protein